MLRFFMERFLTHSLAAMSQFRTCHLSCIPSESLTEVVTHIVAGILAPVQEACGHVQ